VYSDVPRNFDSKLRRSGGMASLAAEPSTTRHEKQSQPQCARRQRKPLMSARGALSRVSLRGLPASRVAVTSKSDVSTYSR